MYLPIEPARLQPPRLGHTDKASAVWYVLAFFSALLLGLTAAPPIARAGLRICNGSVDLVNIAIGYETDSGMRTEGWWTVTANACAQIIQEPLRRSQFYLHVADGFGESKIAGDITLCTEDKRFVVYDGDQCWQRGLIEADFFKVESGGTDDWTVLLFYD